MKSRMKKDGPDGPKQRLLKEAEALFAEKGYHGVSVREITKAACCNLASVNYYFGSKRNLYLEVFRSRWIPRMELLRERMMASLSGESIPSQHSVFRALAGTFLDGPLSDEERRHQGLLMARELARPTPAFDLIAQHMLKPFVEGLRDMSRAWAPQGTSEETLTLNVLSLISLVIYFNFAREAVMRVTGHTYDRAFKGELVEHIVNFCDSGFGCLKG